MKHYGITGMAIMVSLSLLLSTSAPATADNELAASASTFYIIVPGNDSSVAALAHTVGDRLQALFDRANGTGTVWVMPRLSWGPNDLGDQCLNDPGDPKGPQVLGGMILEGTNTYSSTDPLVIWEHGWSKISSIAQLVSCKGVGFKKPTITWVSGDLTGYGSRNGLRAETIAASILAFNPHNSNSIDFAAYAFAGGSGASTVPPVNDATTTRDALHRIVNNLFDDLSAGCSSANINIRPLCEKLGLPQAMASPPPK